MAIMFIVRASDQPWIQRPYFRSMSIPLARTNTTPGLRLTGIIRSVSKLKPNSDLQYVLIRRDRYPNRGSNIQIRPGDIIVVPINATLMPPLPFWRAVTENLACNVAIAAAAIQGL